MTVRGRAWPSTACHRCGEPLAVGSTMSKFNTDQICMQCKKEEREAPGYAAADAAEVAQVRAGNYRFDGVGLSEEDQAYLAAARAARTPKKKESEQ